MSGKPANKLRQPWVYDYRSAIAKAVEWLGDRYLLAEPINATPICRARIRGRRATHDQAHRKP